MESSSEDGDPANTAANSGRIIIVLFLLTPLLHLQSPAPAVHPAKKLPPVVVPAVKTTASAKPPKKLYLTFDDGPNRGTKNVLHIVKEEGVPVSFFVVGEHVDASATQAALWDSLHNTTGIDLCNHSYSHAHNRYSDYYKCPNAVVEDFQRTCDSLQLTNNIARTPGRNIWRIDSLRKTDIKTSTAAADSLQSAGFQLMGWDLEWHFNHKDLCVTHSAQELEQHIDSVFVRNKTQRKDHLVLLAHDQAYSKSADSFQLRQLLQRLKKRDDVELTVVTQYPGIVQ